MQQQSVQTSESPRENRPHTAPGTRRAEARPAKPKEERVAAESRQRTEPEASPHQEVEREGVEFAKFLGSLAVIGAAVSVGATFGLVGLSLLVAVFGWLFSGVSPWG